MLYKRKQLNQDGIVSIVVTLIIMIVLTLIVTGFAQLARREQREALDRQLSAQASYAAESGINALKAALPYITEPSRTSCDQSVTYTGPGTNPFITANSELSETASYTCLLFNQTPPDIILGSVSSDTSEVIPISVVDPSSPTIPKKVDNLNVSWKTKTGDVGVAAPAGGRFPIFQDWGGKNIGVLRLDVIPADPADIKNMSTLDASIRTFFLYPKTSGGIDSKEFSAIKNGEIIDVTCNNGCSFVIKGLAGFKYYVRLRSIYTVSQVSINGASTAGVNTSNTTFVGAQVEIDSTGKANDVLKRIKVRIKAPTTVSSDKVNLSTIPEYVFSSEKDLCKKMVIYPGVLGIIPSCP
jgi:PilX N-terminal